MTPDQLRDKFIEFFEGKGHKFEKPDMLVPRNDPTLLFTGAGMNQFKNEFLGKGRALKRAVTCQPCLRTGDIDNVGKTPYHHTFFEMLGNFSFGDYFKKDAIAWAWEFVTHKNWLNLAPERLCASVYVDDDDACAIWRDEVGLPEDRIYRFGEKDNFWPANAPSKGPDGLCGTCSEIFYDWGEGVFACDNPDCNPSCCCGRYSEIWNLVFQTYTRQGAGNLVPLDQKNIDTGAGFERILAVVNGVHSNYETELILPIIREVEKISGTKYSFKSEKGWRYRRIADHVRALCMLIAENVIPDSADDCGSVLRKLLRRAYLDGRALGVEDDAFLYRLVPVIAQTLAKPYPQLTQRAENIAHVLKEDEKKFAVILDRGWGAVEAAIQRVKAEGRDSFPGSIAFRLHDTHGFPVDVTEEIVERHNLKFDREEFDSHLEIARTTSRNTSKFTGEVFTSGPIHEIMEKHPPTVFVDWAESLDSEEQLTAEVIGIISPAGALAAEWSGEGEVEIFLDRTPFYATAGGQTGDSGKLASPDGAMLVSVIGTYASEGYYIHHSVVEKGVVKVGDKIIPTIDPTRADIQRNHTATHLLHHALRKVLGKGAEQSGSLVEAERLRFDFTHKAAMTPEEIAQVEAIVNEKILADVVLTITEKSLDEAKAEGVIALFGEKYGERVRVVDVGGFSSELCGGTHVARTGEIGLFEILRESSVASGIRRIEAVTGRYAFEHLSGFRRVNETLCRTLKTQPEKLVERVEAMQKEIRELKKGGAKKSASDGADIEKFLAEAGEIGGAKIVCRKILGASMNTLREINDALRSKAKSVAVVLGSDEGGKANLLIALSKDLVEKGLKAGALIKEIAAIVDGSGGGRPDMAQAGGKDASKLDEALKCAVSALKRELE